MGYARTYGLLRDKYFWEKMHKHAYNYRVCADLMGPYPTSADGMKYILLIIDSFSKFPIAYPLPDSKAKTIAYKLVDLFCMVGVITEIHTDCASNLWADVIFHVCRIFNVNKRPSCAVRPRGQGITERQVQTILTSLSRQFHSHPTMWDKFLPFSLLSYRITSHESTGLAPSQILLKFKYMRSTYEELTAEEPPNLTNNCHPDSPVASSSEPPNLTNNFHPDSPVASSSGQVSETDSSETVVSSETKQYQIEKIVKSKLDRGKMQYLVKWLNFANSHNQYVNYKDLNETAHKSM
uniref:Uncharacterized protein LOC102805750 n=1 Tax=Saccoglossus kowalevskii TaxID=10224 RepID=A0ABM0LZ33_SACKO|nr:PREDICTED: uncharacterized protein LOC102805750 [Saccoglossus kowalevskii]